MLEDLDAFTDIDIVICPPFVSIESLADLFDGTSLYLGAQNMHWEEKGAFTGEISPLMLKHRADYVILGHSERRQYFHETDEDVRRKVEAALRHDLRPIVCVGETLSEYEAGDTWHVVSRQVGMALDGLDIRNCVIAYEPIWAIGTGKAATGEIANEVIAQIRDKVRHMHGDEAADSTQILYGGSVNARNIAEFVSLPEIDGALVGGASLEAYQFVRIVAITNEARGKMVQ